MFPEPRSIQRIGGVGSTRVAEIRTDPTLPAQGYELVITEDGTRIAQRDDAGHRYAQQTLRQLEVEHPDGVPAMHVLDSPDLEYRGVMLDISRDRVPTNETLAWLVDVLSELRYNHLQLYTEHTFAYTDHREVWQRASPLTGDDIEWLDRYCRDRGIELAANQNTFGHMERWLALDAYRWRAECPDGARHPVTGRAMAPTTLAPTAANADFSLGLVRELCSHVTSRRVNVGGDEPFELGQGVSSSNVAAHGRAAVAVEHLRRIIEPLTAEGFDVCFWGDVVQRHPELVATLPEGATAVPWWYEAPSEALCDLVRTAPDALREAMGFPDDAHLGMEAFVRGFADVGYPFWVAAGTSSWRSLIGRWDNARGNLLDVATVGRDAGASGILVTDWGDDGHLQPLAVGLLPLVYGAGVSWCADTNADRAPAPIVDHVAGIDGLGSLLDRLGVAHLSGGVRGFNSTSWFSALVDGDDATLFGELDPDGHRDGLRVLDDALDELSSSSWQSPAGRGTTIRDELVAAVRLARQGAWRLGARHGIDGPSAGELLTDLCEAAALQRTAWVTTSRPGGLEDSLGRLPLDG